MGMSSDYPAANRRAFIGLGAAVAGAALLPGSATAIDDGQIKRGQQHGRLNDIEEMEQRYQASVSFYAAKIGARCRPLRHRADDRVPIHSVFKATAAAAVLRDVARRGTALDRLIRYNRSDLVDYSPVTGPNVDRGMTLRELCDAAVRISDNTAANLLLRELGGPSSITNFARSVGDETTRLDRYEPYLNEAVQGDPRDTTTARGIATGFTNLLIGDELKKPDRRILTDWMLRNTTSDRRFRAALPAGWRLADKTGSGKATFNDVGIAWPPSGRPLVIAAFVRQDSPDIAASEQLHVELARLAIRRLT